MKQISIQENIRRLRKEMGLTQERLAEALGVTVGAVSKWETGLSYPDLQMIVELADFFEVSVDALLGCGVERSTAQTLTKRVRTLTNEKRYGEGCAEAEKALQKYPHSFALLHACAILYEATGVATSDKGALLRSRELYERALDFLSENRDEKIGELSIRRGVATTYEIEGRADKAIETLKACNYDGVNDAAIGAYYSYEKGGADSALEYLSCALIGECVGLFRIALGYANAFRWQKKSRDALELLRFARRFLSDFKTDEGAGYLDRLDAILLTQIAFFEMLEGDEARMERTLKKALTQAKKFDRAPSYDLSGLRWCSYASKTGAAVAHDSVGASCLDGIDALLKQPLTKKGDPYAAEQKVFLRHWERIKDEAR